MQPVANLNSNGSWHVIKKWQTDGLHFRAPCSCTHSQSHFSGSVWGYPGNWEDGPWQSTWNWRPSPCLPLPCLPLPCLFFTSKTSKITNKANIIYCLTNKKRGVLKSIWTKICATIFPSKLGEEGSYFQGFLCPLGDNDSITEWEEAVEGIIWIVRKSSHRHMLMAVKILPHKCVCYQKNHPSKMWKPCCIIKFCVLQVIKNLWWSDCSI